MTDKIRLNSIRQVMMYLALGAALTLFASPVATPAATYMGWRYRLPTVTFYGEHKCPACDSARKVLDALEDEYWGRIRVVSVNVRWHKRTALHDSVASTPTLIYRPYKRTEVTRQHGEITQREVHSAAVRLIAVDRAEKHG